MEDHEIAAYLRDQLWRRLSGPDKALVEVVADRMHLTEDCQWIKSDDRGRFEHLKTQFAKELANAGKVAAR